MQRPSPGPGGAGAVKRAKGLLGGDGRQPKVLYAIPRAMKV